MSIRANWPDASGHDDHGREPGTGAVEAAHYDALQEYTAGTPVNNYLRGGTKFEDLDKGDQDMVTRLDEFIAAQKPLDTTLYRMMPSDLVETLSGSDAFVDPGFVSTTQSEKALATIVDEAEETAGIRANQTGVLKITVKNAKGLDVNKQSADNFENHFARQKEIILQRGLKFKVIKKTTMKVKVSGEELELPALEVEAAA